MPDTMPLWFWIPAAIILWTAFTITWIADERATRRHHREHTERLDAILTNIEQSR